MSNIVNIPQPSKPQVTAYKNRTGYFKSDTTLKLVFDLQTMEWKVVDTKTYVKPKSTYITLEDWEAGKKTVNKEALDAITSYYTGKVDDATSTEAAVAGASITMGPSGPLINFASPNEKDPNGNPVVFQAYLYVAEPNVARSPEEAMAGKVSSSEFDFNRTDSGRDRHLKDLYKIYGSKQGIIDALYKGGFLKSNEDIDTSEMVFSLERAIGEYSINQVEAYKSKQIKQFVTFNDWLTSRETTPGMGETRTVPITQVFDESNARALILQMYKELQQREPSEEEYAKWIPKIQRKQEQTPAQRTTVYDAEGKVVSEKTKTGLNEQEWLFRKLSKEDESGAVRLMGLYDAFRQAIGVR